MEIHVRAGHRRLVRQRLLADLAAAGKSATVKTSAEVGMEPAITSVAVQKLLVKMNCLTHISSSMWLVNTSEWIAEKNSDVHSTCPIFRSQY
jgi:hypothetical protein